ncbi:GNAT family N-acetyltransferase [Thalassotalea sp. PP2-459]|uniref:GNAT family N-acetyltransferase n=1 Tax=Thalassotalea sp. PP2-459 TaxID=1742724 RepID=UPI000945386B|nr:GNAT family N-acetyltransferase [Thalassotalea sp. PP2-459]OKY25919.1 GNAT family N-acetyltransferase [Thalassotalea sp. PP2-459]
MQKKTIIYREMTPDDFTQVIRLATHVHGEGYMDQTSALKWFNQGIKNNINSHFVAYDEDILVGFRITFSPLQWQLDQWCTPEDWPSEQASVCYFKCNTVDEHYRGYGIGSKLLTLSIDAVKQQGAKAGVSHLWMQSPGNSAVKYFTKCGGVLITKHPDRWNELSKQGYMCPVCNNDCHCSAAEMLISFDQDA